MLNSVKEKHVYERDSLKARIAELEDENIAFQDKFYQEQSKVNKLFIDAENIRADLHKEIKDYRITKKKLKSIIVQFQDRLEDLRHMSYAKDLTETRDQEQLQEQLQEAQEFTRQQIELLDIDDDTSSDGEDSSSRFS